ncbi:DNA-3-methyladenine glycosylase family protein [Cytobacillus sp. FJAT-54145]|uniref:DNA-3-methyladenine glycosylase II n=1 Tax=Cytobacillus spartinae TaxID=3299023 RepID=A0ABW6KBC6_9BACI
MDLETIKITGPYNFDGVLDRISRDPLNVLNLEERSIKIPIMIEGTPIVAKVTAIGTTNEPAFTVSGIDGDHKEQALNRVTHLLQWDTPLTEVNNFFNNTDLKEIFEQHKGTPLILDFSPYRALLKAIVHQQLNLSFAYTLTKRFVTTYGFEVDGVYFYPSPEKVASLQVEELRELQFSNRKAEYMIGIAKAIVEGTLDLDSLHNKSDDDIMEELIKLKGVGPWTIQCLLMFGLGRPNLFPFADIGLQNALKKLYNMDRKPTKEEMEEYIKDWEPYLSYASLYLWRSIE